MRKAWIILLLGILFTACSRPPAPDFNITQVATYPLGQKK